LKHLYIKVCCFDMHILVFLWQAMTWISSIVVSLLFYCKVWGLLLHLWSTWINVLDIICLLMEYIRASQFCATYSWTLSGMNSLCCRLIIL
jgi:hypothetical protein